MPYQKHSTLERIEKKITLKYTKIYQFNFNFKTMFEIDTQLI